MLWMFTGTGSRSRFRCLDHSARCSVNIAITTIRLAATKALEARRGRNTSRYGTRKGPAAAVPLGQARGAWRSGPEASFTRATAVVPIALAAELLTVATIAGSAQNADQLLWS